MSFLPYANTSTTVWAASFTGSSVVHLGLAALLLTSSVALLPVPIRNEARTPEYEVTLEILDANIIDMTEPAPEDPLIPPDAVALVPDDAAANVPEETDQSVLIPEVETDTELDLVDQDLVLIEDPTTDLMQPDESVQSTPRDLDTPELVELTPDTTSPIAPAVIELPDEAPDAMFIDDVSPIDNTEISPLAERVAPVAITQPDVVIITPDDPTDEQITALVLPDDTAPPTDIAEALLPNLLAPGETPDEDPQPVTVEPTAVVPLDQDPPVVTAEINDPQVIRNPDQATAVIGTLIRRIRATPSPQCTLALPRRAGPEGVGVSFIGAQQVALDSFSGRLLDGLAPTPIQTREIIDQRQCALLDAVRQITDYPAGRIGLALDDSTLRSGENLRGRVIGAGGLFVTLLLIDDNGVVQDMSRFTTLEGNEPAFNAPVARAGLTRATRQIILALGSESGPIDVSSQIGQEAQAVFSALPPEVLANAVFGLATFDVR